MTKPKSISPADSIVINGITYVPENQKPSGVRCVVILDRGFIYAGDVIREDGRIKLSRVTWVFNWESIGLDGVIKDPNNSKVNLRPFSDIDAPAGAEIFSIPVSDDWGIK